MSIKVAEVINLMEKLAPPMLAESWDNVGLMVGEYESKINKILVALDVTDKVIDEAIENDCQLIITHHPLIFGKINKVNNQTPLGKRIIKLIKNNIAVYSAHTNLDMAKFGTNDTLAKLIGLNEIDNLCEPIYDDLGLGKVGILQNEVSFGEFIQFVKKTLKLESVIACGDLNTKIKKVGLGTGKCSGLEYMQRAKKLGCDVYITGDVGYHDAQNSVDLGLCLIDAGHYGTEVIVVDEIIKYLNNEFKKANIDVVLIASKIDGNGLKVY